MTRSTGWRSGIGGLATVIAALWLVSLGLAAALESDSGFVRRSGYRFVDARCREFMYSGFNSWAVLEAAAGISKFIPSDQSHFEGKSMVDWLFETASSSGLRVARFFGHGHEDSSLVLQTSPGEYNEDAMIALDTVINQAGTYGMKVILTLADNWMDADSKKRFAEWAGKSEDEFFTDSAIRDLYKNHISFMVNRVNTQNGIAYRDEPAIFAWNLMNEPRCNCDVFSYSDACKPECADSLQAWIEEMSLFLKEQDPKHMITVGEEGFYSFNSGREHVNPDHYTGSDDHMQWAKRSGQDFVRNHDLLTIDYAGIHSWPDNWGVLSTSFQETWVREHINDAWGLGKPIVVEEFGKIVSDDNDGSRRSIRDPYFSTLYNLVESEINSDSPLKGVGFWEFDAQNNSNPDDYDVQTAHSTWKEIIVPFTQKFNEVKNGRPLVENCAPGDSRSYDAVIVGSEKAPYYVSAGPGLVASNEGDDLGQSASFISPSTCAELCESTADCNSFSYNINQEGGTCFLKKDAEGPEIWNADGWQTFYKSTGSYDCTEVNKEVNNEGCTFCANDGTCLQCNAGSILFSGEDGFPFCKGCDSIPEAIQGKRYECGGDSGASAGDAQVG